jgi:hypothetical protein
MPPTAAPPAPPRRWKSRADVLVCNRRASRPTVVSVGKHGTRTETPAGQGRPAVAGRMPALRVAATPRDNLVRTDRNTACTAETRCAWAETQRARAETRCARAETRCARAETQCARTETQCAQSETRCARAETRCAQSETRCARPKHSAHGRNTARTAETQRAQPKHTCARLPPHDNSFFLRAFA